MARWGMVIDLDKCSGCQACNVACATENNVSLGDAKHARDSRIIRWLTFVSHAEGVYPHLKREMFLAPCLQCENPPCTAVCPVSATYKNGEGVVGQIYWRCIGCRYCVNACPYTCKYFNWDDPKWPGEIARATNPDVELRTKGVTEKCLFCYHRLQRAKEQAKVEKREVSSDDYVPACAEACPTEAIFFGDLDDDESEVSVLSRDPRAMRLLEDIGTHPKVWHMREK